MSEYHMCKVSPGNPFFAMFRVPGLSCKTLWWKIECLILSVAEQELVFSLKNVQNS